MNWLVTLHATQGMYGGSGVPNMPMGGEKSKVMTGYVTKMYDTFGYIDDKIFFMKKGVRGHMVREGDRVMAEAVYQPNMPIKWNADLVKLVEKGSEIRNQYNSSGGGKSGGGANDRPPSKRHEQETHGSSKRSSRSPASKRSRTQKIVPTYRLNYPSAVDVIVPELKQRYHSMYIPSDFFSVRYIWYEAFPLYKPLSLCLPTVYHILSYDMMGEVGSADDAVIGDARVIDYGSHNCLEPTDVDYTWSAKVMLPAFPDMFDLYKKTCQLSEYQDESRESHTTSPLSPDRILQFLVGSKGKSSGELLSIGGAWSPSLDGDNPEQDPLVLINTAIRTCKAMIGLDLSKCTEWYRFLELHYYRSASSGTTVGNTSKEAHVETVVIFIPDVWSCMPTEQEWTQKRAQFKEVLETKLYTEEEVEDITGDDDEDDDEMLGGDAGEPETIELMDAEDAVTDNAESEDQTTKKKVTEPPKVAAKPKKAARQRKMIKKMVCKLGTEERKKLESQYTLPEHPCLLVCPHPKVKSGRLELRVSSLKSLLAYTLEDSKETTFEVSLFSEQFYQMLERDAAFTIYRALLSAPEKVISTVATEDGTKNEDEATAAESQRAAALPTNVVGVASFLNTSASHNMAANKSSHAANKDVITVDRESGQLKVKRTIDPKLLFSFILFDPQRSGKLTLKDLDDLLHSMSLNLSRSQVRHLLSKVSTSATAIDMEYRKLTDREVYEGDDLYDIISSCNPNFDINTNVILEMTKMYEASLGTILPGCDSNATLRPTHADECGESVAFQKLLMSKVKAAMQCKMAQEELAKMTKKAEETQVTEKKLEDQVTELQEKVAIQLKKEQDAKDQYEIYLQLLTSTTELSKTISNIIGAQFDEEKKERERERAIKLEKERVEKEAKEKERAEKAQIEKEKREAEKLAKEKDAPKTKSGGVITVENDDADECPEEWEVVDAV